MNDSRDTTETTTLSRIRIDDEESVGRAGRRRRDDGPASVGRRRRDDTPRPARSHRTRERLALLLSLWPLLPILVVQSVFAWRLVVTNTAFLDEATYMWSGRLVVDHFLHGRKLPEFQTFFSGAPVLYPVLAAVASKLGGLTGARLLSLAFMLLTTTAVFLTGRRLHGALTGFFAAGLFAALGSTLHLSAFATFDAMALCLLAWSTYFVIRFAYGLSRNALLYAAILMVLADCTKYASLLWNPIIIALAATTGPGYAAWRCSRTWNLQRFAMVSTTLLALAIVIGRQPYFTGFDSTTLQRGASDSSTKSILDSVAGWIGPLLALALLGMLVALWQLRRGTRTRPELATFALLLLAGLLAPANQLRIHTLLSLNKHVAFGASFAAIPAGYLLARLVGVLSGTWQTSRARHAVAAAAIALAALIPLNLTGVKSGTALHDAWPNSTKLIAALKPLVHKGTEKYLVEDDYVAAYYLPNINYEQWRDTFSTSYDDSTTRTTLTGVVAFKAAILAHEYKIIVLNYGDTQATDDAITGTINKAKYRRVARIPVKYGSSNVVYDIWEAP